MEGLIAAFIELIFGLWDSMVADAEGVLTNAAFDTGQAWEAVEKVSEVLKPFCYFVIGLCCLIELAQVAAKVDLIKWEHGLKLGVKMVFAKLIIDIAPRFLRACYEQANEWITGTLALGAEQSIGAMMAEQVRIQLDGLTSGLLTEIGLFVIFVLIGLAIGACALVILAIAYGRMFELYVYLAVSPLPCAFFPLGDGSGGGLSRITTRFFKSFIAVCLQGVMIVVCLRLFNVIIASNIEETVKGIQMQGNDPAAAVMEMGFMALLGAIVLVMSVSKCGSWAKSIIDAM